MKSAIIAITLASFCTLASADFGQPSHTCFKPTKPYKFFSDMEVDNYNRQVRDYRDCIQRFIKEQREQANNHLQAAKQAIEEWNQFAQFGY